MASFHVEGTKRYGIEDDGEISGCDAISLKDLNAIEACHVQRCPQAEPEIKRFSVVVGNQPNFCIGIYLPYLPACWGMSARWRG